MKSFNSPPTAENPQDVVNREIDAWFKLVKDQGEEFDEITIAGITEICGIVQRQLPDIPPLEIEQMVKQRLKEII